ncbi:nuclear transport factor 2 family protein [Rhizobium puerariae]|uniref:Nuclear transport factor 2 family protein n=1 Tax=Rhizobium puerariae TaxID=1585791 RepID=A0ABV6ABF8_9HYPH
MTIEELEARIEKLEARADMDALMQRYAAAADRKYTALGQKQPPEAVAAAARDQAECFTVDGRWSGGGFGGDLQGRAAIAGFFETSPWLFTAHHYGAPSMDIAGDGAQVRWRLLEIGIREQDGKVLLLTGAVSQHCRRTGEGWRIAQMAFESLHAICLAELPTELRCLIPAGEVLS